MDIGYILTVLAVIFVSMTLHELVHGLVAYWLGDETARLLGRLTLNPIKHVDPIMTIMLPILIMVTNLLTGSSTPVFGGAKPVPFNPANIEHDEWGVALMAAAGPLTNLFLAFISYASFVIAGANQSTIIGQLAVIATVVNLGFFAFNIIPLPPLDGSRVMYALAPDFVRDIMDYIERYGIFVVFFVVIIAGPWLNNYITGVVGMFIGAFAHIFGIA